MPGQSVALCSLYPFVDLGFEFFTNLNVAWFSLVRVDQVRPIRG
ncbi:MAG: hypothetical protein NT013_01320 [Planctomycetia bacterium]|nr:hypothetical protein [Planctomycetia bacterium]